MKDQSACQDGKNSKSSIPARLAAAKSLCQERGLTLTPMRQQALEILWSAEIPLGAYDLLAKLEPVIGKKLKPPTVYRALEFLVKHGFVTRIESLNAFVACAHPERHHQCVFLLCGFCHTSTEIENTAIEKAMTEEALQNGFKISQCVFELRGICPQCQSLL